uniref:Uncharacterized protein n=1 Tax=Ascaris lumbricoides TaxID=6252 RepID=A0A0M3IT11_ASCLU
MDSLAIYCPFFNETTPHNETETFVILRVCFLARALQEKLKFMLN